MDSYATALSRRRLCGVVEMGKMAGMLHSDLVVLMSRRHFPASNKPTILQTRLLFHLASHSFGLWSPAVLLYSTVLFREKPRGPSCGRLPRSFYHFLPCDLQWPMRRLCQPSLMALVDYVPRRRLQVSSLYSKPSTALSFNLHRRSTISSAMETRS